MEPRSPDLFQTVFLPATSSAGSQEYEPYFHIKGYLRQKYRESGRTIPELARMCGYKKLEKFRLRVGLWLQARKPIPRRFLEAIGTDPKTVCLVMHLDFDQYECAVKRVFYPQTFSARLVPAVWQRLPLPPNLNESQARDYVAGYARLHNRRCMINLEGLREIWVDPGGTVYNCLNWPSIKFSDGMLRFHNVSARAGLTRLAGHIKP